MDTDTFYWDDAEWRKQYSDKQRKDLAKSGAALPDGSFPIVDKADLSNAISAYGRASDKAAAKAHIKKRAKALGATDMLPESWSQRSAFRRGSSRGREVRSYLDRNVEIRSATEDDGKVTLRGMVIKYGVPYTVRDAFGEFTETIERGAAQGIIGSDPDVRFLFNHQGIPLARTTTGTLTLRDLTDGVEVEARLDPDMPSAKDVIGAVSGGLITQMSVGMVVGNDTWNDTGDSRSIARLSSIPDVSAVTYPASPTTSIEAVKRQLEANPELRAQLEDDVLPSARLDHIEHELRAGKTLSAATATQLVGMARSMHDLLAAGGADFSHTADSDDTSDDAEGDSDESLDTDGAVDDALSEMSRDDELDAELRQMQLEQLLVEQELIEASH